MRSFAPCLVVMLAGLALGVASGFAWITGDAYTGEHVAGVPGPALVAVPPVSSKPVPVSYPAEVLAVTRAVIPSRGGEAPGTQ